MCGVHVDEYLFVHVNKQHRLLLVWEAFKKGAGCMEFVKIFNFELQISNSILKTSLKFIHAF